MSYLLVWWTGSQVWCCPPDHQRSVKAQGCGLRGALPTDLSAWPAPGKEMVWEFHIRCDPVFLPKSLSVPSGFWRRSG